MFWVHRACKLLIVASDKPVLVALVQDESTTKCGFKLLEQGISSEVWYTLSKESFCSIWGGVYETPVTLLKKWCQRRMAPKKHLGRVCRVLLTIKIWLQSCKREKKRSTQDLVSSVQCPVSSVQSRHSEAGETADLRDKQLIVGTAVMAPWWAVQPRHWHLSIHSPNLRTNTGTGHRDVFQWPILYTFSISRRSELFLWKQQS